MKIKIHPDYKHKASQIEDCIKNFDSKGKLLVDGKRNELRVFDLDGTPITVKSFKIPNLINRVAYRYFRKSKARRSYEYAQRLRSLGIGTPAPIAFAEAEGALYSKSFYVCAHIDFDLEFRDLVDNPLYAKDTEILRAFTAFTFMMHEQGVHFLDHSPGNTLIQKTANGYSFYLVDLNRMAFKRMGFKDRMQNMSRLTPKRKMVKVMAKEYARLAGYDELRTLNALWSATANFQKGFHRKKRIKKRLGISKK